MPRSKRIARMSTGSINPRPRRPTRSARRAATNSDCVADTPTAVETAVQTAVHQTAVQTATHRRKKRNSNASARQTATQRRKKRRPTSSGSDHSDSSSHASASASAAASSHASASASAAPKEYEVKKILKHREPENFGDEHFFDFRVLWQDPRYPEPQWLSEKQMLPGSKKLIDKYLARLVRIERNAILAKLFRKERLAMLARPDEQPRRKQRKKRRRKARRSSGSKAIEESGDSDTDTQPDSDSDSDADCVGLRRKKGQRKERTERLNKRRRKTESRNAAAATLSPAPPPRRRQKRQAAKKSQVAATAVAAAPTRKKRQVQEIDEALLPCAPTCETVINSADYWSTFGRSNLNLKIPSASASGVEEVPFRIEAASEFSETVEFNGNVEKLEACVCVCVCIVLQSVCRSMFTSFYLHLGRRDHHQCAVQPIDERGEARAIHGKRDGQGTSARHSLHHPTRDHGPWHQ